MRRLLRILNYKLDRFLGKPIDIVYNDGNIEGQLPQEWISEKIMDKDIMIYNLGYKEKYKGYLVVVTPVVKNQHN